MNACTHIQKAFYNMTTDVVRFDLGHLLFELGGLVTHEDSQSQKCL